MMSVSVIIPTYNRPHDLANCVRSLLAQTVQAAEIIVVDDGELPCLPFSQECADRHISYVYFRKSAPGLTASRNKGISLASGDIIFFLDDDVVLFDNYLEEILKVYQGDGQGLIGGVGGVIENQKPGGLLNKLMRIVEIPLLVSGINEGKVLPSGFCVNYGKTPFPVREVKEVDFLFGGACSFRREVFRKHSFNTDSYLRYGLGEDKDFSLQVKKDYRIFINPAARLLHVKSPSMRADRLAYSRMFVRHTCMFFKKYVRKSALSWVLFWYAMTGFLVTRVLYLVASPRKGNLDRVRGIVLGIKDVVLRDTVVR